MEIKGLLSRSMRVPQYSFFWTYSFIRTTPVVWKLSNKSATALHEKHPPHLDEVQQKVLNELEATGIATVHLDEIMPGGNLFSKMLEHSERAERNKRDGIRKPFLQYFWHDYLRDETAVIDLDNPFIRFALNTRVLDVVNSYMGMWSKLVLVDLSKTKLMSPSAPPIKSQRWHRDIGVKRYVKVFLYLNDIDDESGPFIYVLQSHMAGRWGRLFPQRQFGRRVIYPPAGAVEKTVPKADIKVCTGTAGTMVFCDVVGFHRGGYSISKPRILFTAGYAAKGDLMRPRWKVRLDPVDLDKVATVDPVSRFAVE